MRSIALVESPLQFLGALEAYSALQDPFPLEIRTRTDAPGMRRFLDRFPRSWLPTDVTVVPNGTFPTPDWPDTVRLYIGDPFSGLVQKILVAHGPGRRTGFVLLDDGFATPSAVRVIASRRPAPLVRERQAPTPARTALGVACSRLLHGWLRAGRLSWVTALHEAPEAEAFAAAGGRLVRHTFDVTRALPSSASPVGGRVLIGSAMPTDGLIHSEDYLAWVSALAETGPLEYFPHRRETPRFLDELRGIPQVHVHASGLPVEIRLAGAAPHTEVHGLPSSAFSTLPFVMRDPHLHVHAVPADWWTGTAPDALRRRLNTASGATGDESRRYTIVSVSDSESYLKWAARTLDALGTDFDTHLLLLDNPILPTAEQIGNALVGSSWEGAEVPVVDPRDLRTELERRGPDLVLAAATGPIVVEVNRAAAFLTPRPGLLTGLPGVGLPATSKGMRYRRMSDVFIAHSEKERRAYEFVAEKNDVPLEVLVGRLPLLASHEPPRPVMSAAEVPRTLVFAPQAKVPKIREDREAILRSLARFRRNHPGSEVIVKVRSRPGEQETHHEEFTYISLIDDLVAAGEIRADELTVAVGPMSEFLVPGAALVTVSSTAALESLDRGLPTMIISDFGVSEEMLNIAFEGAGDSLGTLADVEAGRFGFPSTAWLEDNYFQQPNSELTDALTVLAERARAGQLPDVRALARIQGYRQIRARVRSRTPKPLVRAYRFGKKGLRKAASIAR